MEKKILLYKILSCNLSTLINRINKYPNNMRMAVTGNKTNNTILQY